MVGLVHKCGIHKQLLAGFCPQFAIEVAVMIFQCIFVDMGQLLNFFGGFPLQIRGLKISVSLGVKVFRQSKKR